MKLSKLIKTTGLAISSAAVACISQSGFALDTPDLLGKNTAAAIFAELNRVGFSAGLVNAKDFGLEIATAQLADFAAVATDCGSTIQTEENAESESVDNRECNVAASTSKIQRVCYADAEKVLWFHIKADSHKNLAGKNIALIPAQSSLGGNIAISFGAGDVICLTDATHPTTEMVSKESNNPVIGELMGTGKSCLYVDFSVTNDSVTTALKTALGMPQTFIDAYNANDPDSVITAANACD